METCLECGKQFESLESVHRHQRIHGQTSQAYVLKWTHGGTVPTCACGCRQETSWSVGRRDYAKYIRGHSAKGRVKSEDEKRRIGEKNRVNMKEWMSRHPDIVARHMVMMRSTSQTEESRKKRSESVRATYDAMSPEDKQKFSDHTRGLWSDGTLVEARTKAAETFKQRYASGEYDFTERNAKISETITQRYLDGGFEWAIGTYHSRKIDRTFSYRSSWELQFMQLLDADDEVETWTFEPFSIPYEFDGERRRYVPDFHVVTRSGSSIVVEVKPHELRETPMNSAKREATKDFCQRSGWTYAEWHPGSSLAWK